MLKALTMITITALCVAYVAAKIVKGTPHTHYYKTGEIQHLKKNAIICGPDWESLETALDELDIPLIAGSGDHNWTISTKSDSAQRYFNQGLNMYYSFHIIEAMASFKKAAKFDPDCAMIYWAQALAYGPNINDLGYAASPAALAATGRATALSATASELEKAFIDAMKVRYTTDSADATRAQLNRHYTAMMKTVYDKYNTHPDAQALYADAMMLEHPWDLWNVNGSPKSWTPLIQQVLEKLLEKFPGHPGANHYYIHVMEPSPFASKAIASADRLGKLTPALSHTVHMPSHIYLLTGQYQQGVAVNEQAVKSYKNMSGLYAPVTSNDFLYIIHNLHMQTNNAMMAGQAQVAIQSAQATMNSIAPAYLDLPAPLGTYVQYIYMTPTLVNIRFGKWNELLAGKQPPEKLLYANILFQFGRGMAFTHNLKLADAKLALQKMQLLMRDSSLFIPFSPFSPAIDGAVVAEQLLQGSIALAERNFPAAIPAFEKAVGTEENMVYNEPRDWLLNPKHYLGNAYLAAGQPLAAEKIFSRDLANNNENGWALFGSYQSLLARKRIATAEKMLGRFRQAFIHADIKLTAAVY